MDRSRAGHTGLSSAGHDRRAKPYYPRYGVAIIHRPATKSANLIPPILLFNLTPYISQLSHAYERATTANVIVIDGAMLSPLSPHEQLDTASSL